MNRPATIALSVVLTTALAALAWWVMGEAPRQAGGTFLSEFRILVGVLAVFGVLSVADRILNLIVARVDRDRPE